MLGAVVRVDETGTWIDQSVVPVAKDFLEGPVCLSVDGLIDCLLLISYYYLSRLSFFLSFFLPSFLPSSFTTKMYLWRE